MNREKKRELYRQRIDRAQHDSKKLWKVMNDIMGRSTNASASFIETDNGVFISKPKEMSNYLNKFFVEKVENLRGGFCTNVKNKSCLLIDDLIMKGKHCTFEFNSVEIKEVEKLLRSISKDNSTGTDCIDGKLLRIAVDYIALPVCHIFNSCLSNGTCPKIWKEGKIIPIPKDTKSTFSGPNCRPITILPVLSKILERIVYNQIHDYMSKNDLISNAQHAYREGHSTCTALVKMTDDWLRGIDNSLLSGAVMLDFSAAFDLIDHKLLIEKLTHYGFGPMAISWFENYLSFRTQQVFLNGTLSNSINIDCGVPQGSCLGPLLFSIFTNDLPLVIQESTLVLYADDSTLYYSASTCCKLKSVLSQDLKAVVNWVTANRLVLNLSKTVSIVFGSRHNVASQPMLDLQISSQPVKQESKLKLLGLSICNTLSWTDHVRQIVAKMSRSIATVRKCATYSYFTETGCSNISIMPSRLLFCYLGLCL